MYTQLCRQRYVGHCYCYSGRSKGGWADGKYACMCLLSLRVGLETFNEYPMLLEEKEKAAFKSKEGRQGRVYRQANVVLLGLIQISDAVGNEYGKAKDLAGETRMAFTSYADAAFDVCFENILTSGRMSFSFFLSHHHPIPIPCPLPSPSSSSSSSFRSRSQTSSTINGPISHGANPQPFLCPL